MTNDDCDKAFQSIYKSQKTPNTNVYYGFKSCWELLHKTKIQELEDRLEDAFKQKDKEFYRNRQLTAKNSELTTKNSHLYDDLKKRNLEITTLKEQITKERDGRIGAMNAWNELRKENAKLRECVEGIIDDNEIPKENEWHEKYLEIDTTDTEGE